MEPHVLHKQNWANGDTNGRSKQTRPALAVYNRERKREQSVTTSVHHMTFQNSIFFGQQPTLARKPSTRWQPNRVKTNHNCTKSQHSNEKCTLMMRLTSSMSSATPTEPLGTKSSSFSSPSIQDNKHKMKEKMNHALSRNGGNKSENILIDIENR